MMFDLKWLLVAICCFGSKSIVVAAAKDDSSVGTSKRLPNVWGAYDGAEPKEDVAFRILSEIQLNVGGNQFKSYIFEEWAKADTKSYRLDVVDRQTHVRATIVSNDEIKRKFAYKPFTCSPFAEFAQDLKSFAPFNEFAKLFPSKHSFINAGVASIWLSAISSNEALQTNVSASFDSYTAKATTEFPYKINFYFLPEVGAQLHSVEQIVAIKLVDSKKKVIFQARIIELDSSAQQTKFIISEPLLFEPPEGYGCAPVHVPKPDGIKYSAPANCFSAPTSSGASKGRSFELELVSTLFPSGSGSATSDKLKSHVKSVRLSRGIDPQGCERVVVERQDRFAKSSPTATSGVARVQLRREKRVWSCRNGRGPASVYFDLDEQKNTCLETGQADESFASVIEFPIAVGGEQNTTLTAGVSISSNSLHMLFGEGDAFSLIRAKRIDYLRVTSLIEERRIEEFVLRNREGVQVWKGPASIVRSSTISNEPLNGEEKRGAQKKSSSSVENAKVYVTIKLLAKSLDEIVGEVKLSLTPCRLINAAILHRQLNIGSCLGGVAPPTGANQQQVEFSLSFAPQNCLLDKRSLLRSELEQLVYGKFLEMFSNLVGPPPASKGSSSQDKSESSAAPALDLIQLTGVKVDVLGQELLQVSAKLTEWPKLFAFQQTEGLRFSDSSANNVFRERKSNAADCATSCEHYNCQAFAFSSEFNLCDLLLVDVAPSDLSAIQLVDNNWSVYVKWDRSEKMRPKEFVQLLRERLLNEESANSKLLLELGVYSQYFCEAASFSFESKLSLAPISVEFKAGNGQAKQVVEGNQLELNRLDGDEEENNENQPIKAEYELVLENWRFDNSLDKPDGSVFPIEEANQMSYEQCESLCGEQNCRSFSYCRFERVCLISASLHSTGEIEAKSRKAEACRIFARDYLSRFSQIGEFEFGDEKRPEADYVEEREVFAVGGKRTSRDCATSCIEQATGDDEPRNKCRSFLYCKPNGVEEPPRCYLSPSDGRRQAVGSATRGRRRRRQALNGTTTTTTRDAASATTCTLFARSYLADFKQVNGKRLSSSNQIGATANVHLFDGLSAESCASLCVEQKCTAFHVCRGATGTSLPLCAVLLIGGGVADAFGGDKASEEPLEESKGCTAFRALKGAYLSEAATTAAQDSRPAAQDFGATSCGFRSLLGTIGASLLIGYLLTWLYATNGHVLADYVAGCGSALRSS